MRGFVLLELLVTLTVAAIALAALASFSLATRRALATHSGAERLRAHYALDDDADPLSCTTKPMGGSVLALCTRPPPEDLAYPNAHPARFALFVGGS